MKLFLTTFLVIVFISVSQSANVTVVNSPTHDPCEELCKGSHRICVDEISKQYCIDYENSWVHFNATLRKQWFENGRFFSLFDCEFFNTRDKPLYFFNIRTDVCDMIRDKDSSCWNIEFLEVHGQCGMFPLGFKQNKIIVAPKSSYQFGFIIPHQYPNIQPSFEMGGVRYESHEPTNNVFKK